MNEFGIFVSFVCGTTVFLFFMIHWRGTFFRLKKVEEMYSQRAKEKIPIGGNLPAQFYIWNFEGVTITLPRELSEGEVDTLKKTIQSILSKQDGNRQKQAG